VDKPLLVTPAHCEKENVLVTQAHYGKIVKRKMAMVIHAHCDKENGHGLTPIAKRKMALVTHAHCEKKIGLVIE
jgi:hypothetical protein